MASVCKEPESNSLNLIEERRKTPSFRAEI